MKIIKYFINRKTILVLLASLAISGIFHGWNMMGFPYFENDEGIYFSQAYAAAYEQHLSNYTYWYDHIPFGWLVIGTWIRLTGGPFTFGYSLLSGRWMMLVFHLLSATLIFMITKRVSKRSSLACLAVILFSISPLSIYFQRRLLLDNIMTFFLLLSLTILLYSKSNIIRVLFAGVVFGLAVLSKEIAIIFLPIYLWLAYSVLSKKQGRMGLAVFSLPTIFMLSYYVLFAALRNELFPGLDHVSLIETWKFHLSRGGMIPFWNQQSEFARGLKNWMAKDAIFLLYLFASLVWSIFAKIPRLQKIISLIGWSFIFFIIRGGLVIDFYLIPLLAFGSISLTLFIDRLIRIRVIGFALVTILIVFWINGISFDTWLNDETTPQIESVNWVKENISPDVVLAVDHSQLLDLRLSRFPGDPSFSQADWYLKYVTDPKIKETISGDWKNIEYIILTHEFINQAYYQTIDEINPLLDYSEVLGSWGPISEGTYLNLSQRRSTNGDWAMVLKRYDPAQIVLNESWRKYRDQFITHEGQVIDLQSGVTTSEGQAYAMLRSVFMNDQKTFDVVLQWTSSHQQHRLDDKLFSWKWGNLKDGSQGLLDFENASDADIDIATSLILASSQWKDETYLQLAQPIIQDIWKKNVVTLNGKMYLIAGTWAGYGDSIVINPSYFSPASYRLFLQVDPSHPWNKLARDTYSTLHVLSNQNKSGLIADWYEVLKNTGEISLASSSQLSSDSSYDAMRIYWRIAQDYWWNDSTLTLEWLNSQQFLPNYYESHGNIAAGYYLDGSPLTDYTDMSFYGALLPYAKAIDEHWYHQLLDDINEQYNSGSWGEVENYYTQNWVWLGIALSEQMFELPTIPEVDY